MIKLFISLPTSILFYSLLLTILIDLLDHSINIFLINNPLSKKVKEKIFNLKIKDAYTLYYKKRKENVYLFMVLHNYIFLLISFIISIYSKSYVIFIGIVFHLFCDILELRIEKNNYPGFNLKFYFKNKTRLKK